MHCPRSLKGKHCFIKSSDFVKSPMIIGQGAYGVVYKGTYQREQCALKYIRSYLFERVSAKEYTMRQFERECELAKQMSNPYIVQFIGVSFDDHVPVLITELMECSLTEALECRRCGVPYHKEVDTALSVARGLDYLHSLSPPVVHRDLSSNNVLLASDYQVKLADLGVAKCVSTDSCSPMPGTTVYMPPEVFEPSPLSVAIDMFSYGVLLIQLETRHYPAPADRAVQESEDVKDERGEVDGEGEGKWGGSEKKEVLPGRDGASSEERRTLKTKTEIKRRSNHISLMEKAGVFYQIVQCYLVNDPKIRRRVPLKEVIGWLEEATTSPQYSDSVRTNPEVPLDHKTGNHKGNSLSSSVSHQETSSHHRWWQRVIKKSTGGEDDSGYHSQQTSTRHTAQGLDQTSGDWVKVEGQVPSDGASGGRGLLSSAVYSLNRLSNALGLTAADEDDEEYRQRVMKSL